MIPASRAASRTRCGMWGGALSQVSTLVCRGTRSARIASCGVGMARTRNGPAVSAPSSLVVAAIPSSCRSSCHRKYATHDEIPPSSEGHGTGVVLRNEASRRRVRSLTNPEILRWRSIRMTQVRPKRTAE